MTSVPGETPFHNEGDPYLYMTPRATEMAINVGMYAVTPNLEVIEGIKAYVDTEMNSPEYRFPCEVSELNIVMRWSGRGNMLRLPGIINQWDILFAEAKPETPYLSAGVVTQHHLDRVKMGDPLDEADRLKADLDPYKTIEVSVPDWEDPRFAEKFTNGIIFRNTGRPQKSLAAKVWRDVFEAFDPESKSRFRVGSAAGKHFEDPLDAHSPVLRMFDEEKRRKALGQ